MEHSRETIAMLIDADNSPSDKIDFILSEMAKYGVVNIRRAYGNWKSHSLKGWENKLHDYAIRPIQQFDYTKGKNATDMAMTIDAMDLLYSKKLDAFCIVSSDSDFTPLVMRILSEGLNVYGFGQKSAPAPFVNACSTFLYVESFGGAQEKSRNDGGRRRSSQQLKSDSKLLTLLRNGVDSVEEEDGWSNLAKIGKHISNQASFDPRNYGFKRLSDLIRSIELFEIEFRNNNSELYIRDKRKARKSDSCSGEGSGASAESEPTGSHRDAPQPDSFGHGDRERSSRPRRYRQPSHEQQSQDSDIPKISPEPEGDRAAELGTSPSSQLSPKPEPAGPSVAEKAALQSESPKAAAPALAAEKSSEPEAAVSDSPIPKSKASSTSQESVEKPATLEAVSSSAASIETAETETPPAPKKTSRRRMSSGRRATARKIEASESAAGTGTDPEESVPAPSEPSVPEVSQKATEAGAMEFASAQPVAADATPKKTTRRRMAKPRATFASKAKTAMVKESEASRLDEEATAVPVEASAETPEPEKKPKRTTRRRTTRKKSEGETPSAKLEQ